MPDSMQSDVRRTPVSSTDKRSSSLLFHHLIRFVGGLTGAIAALFVTGYLADRALYRFAGLPMISVDQQSLAERGAQVFIESVGSLFTEQWRLVLLCLGLSTIIGVAIYHERIPLLRRLRDDHRVFFAAQALTLVLSILTLVGLLELVAQADPQQYRYRAEATRSALGELRRDPEWTPVREDELLARSTYPTRGLLRLFSLTFEPRPPVTLAALEAEGLGSDSSAEVGYPLRRTRTDRRNAQRLYGWIIFTMVLLLAVGVGLRRWRRYLIARSDDFGDEETPTAPIPDSPATTVERTPPAPTSVPGTAQSRLSQLGRLTARLRRADDEGRPGRRLSIFARRAQRFLNQPLRQRWLDAGRTILAPVMAGTLTFCLLLLPTCYGVLMVGFIGEERVTVHLIDDFQARCKPAMQIFSPGAPPPADVPDIDGSPSSTSMATSNASSASPAGRVCARREVTRAAEAAEKIESAWVTLAQKRRASSDFDEQLEAYRGAVDELASVVVEHACPEVMRIFDAHLPDPGGFSGLSAAADYYLSVWQRVQSTVSLARTGIILRQPRGKQDLLLFRPLTRRTPTRTGRWLLHAIPRSCIREVAVSTDLERESIRRTLDALTNAPDLLNSVSRLGPILANGSRAATVAILELVTNPHLPDTLRGPPLTKLGTFLGLQRDHEPELVQLAVDSLIREIERQPDPRRAPQAITLAGSAVTALHIIGGPYAAKRFAELLERSGQRMPDAMPASEGRAAAGGIPPAQLADSELPLRFDVPMFGHRAVRGTATTTAGYLASDLHAWMLEAEGRPLGDADGASESPDWRRAAASSLYEYVVSIFRHDDLGHRSSAASALALMVRVNPADIEDLLVGRLDAITHHLASAEGGDDLLAWEAAALLTSCAVAGTQRARASARRIARAASLPDMLRATGLVTLQALGAYPEAEVVTELVLREGRLGQIAETLLSEVEPLEAARRLLTTALDARISLGIRRNAVLRLAGLEDLEHRRIGITLFDQLPALTEVGLRDEACHVLPKLHAALYSIVTAQCSGVDPQQGAEMTGKPACLEGEGPENRMRALAVISCALTSGCSDDACVAERCARELAECSMPL